MVAVSFAAPRVACAKTTDIDAEADAAQQEVERTAAAYDEAVALVDELDAKIADNEQRIEQIEAALPEQQERSAQAMRFMYKFQQQVHALIDMVLGAGDLNSFLTTYEYLDHLHARNMAEIDELASLSNELDRTKATLADAKVEANQALDEASDALAAAQTAREDAQRRAQEQAEREAAERAAAEAAAAAAAQKQQDDERAAAEVDQETSQEFSESSSGASSGEQVSGGITTDDADWSLDKTAFVSEWANRIDAYLAGSPLAGQGTAFAEAAWNYGVDPRWSPAIAYTESSLGAACFLPHNAWGWGSSSWGSWEEAIDTHVRGLARGYGYTISEAAAKKYCPPNWQHWYNTTSAQMSYI
ncbi:coiled-coil domain-containing protein [Adlercreutzia sp. ZJ141]|uniref:coiled-coil domain-containing protein n=1 Tax=Adlercreutzia sp. ZJ141 TaxID=2709406 RepID=UPI0013ECBFC3|nr:hypothetical protein [Adlercreutzia sp. ZJ141]